jgi:hypothetical protein
VRVLQISVQISVQIVVESRVPINAVVAVTKDQIGENPEADDENARLTPFPSNDVCVQIVHI